MISIYDKKTSYAVIGGLAGLHILVATLCGFWIYRFLIISYDPSVFVLLALFAGMTILCDVLVFKIQIVQMCLTRCYLNQTGVYSSILGIKRWSLLWDDICFFGIEGYATGTGMVILFFSCDAKGFSKKQDMFRLSDKQVFFQISKDRWNRICQHIPPHMQKKLQKSFEREQDCYYRC